MTPYIYETGEKTAKGRDIVSFSWFKSYAWLSVEMSFACFRGLVCIHLEGVTTSNSIVGQICHVALEIESMCRCKVGPIHNRRAKTPQTYCVGSF